jgi:AhpD family alkylhydroperoxidase
VPNPLLQRVAPDAMDGWLRAAYQESRALQESKGGDATFYEIGANAPHMLEWYFKSFYEGIFYGGRVEVRIKELLRYRLSMTHGCAFCNKGNVEAARRAGVTDAQLDAIMDEASDVFSERERAVLRLGAEMVLPNMEGQLTPALYADLSAHFDDGEVFELGMVAAVLTGIAKFLFVYDLVEREAHCPVGPRVAA